MSMPDPLSVLLPSAMEQLPSNPPGLPVIQYRVGTFSTFRRAMLDDVLNPDLLVNVAALLNLSETPENPFGNWHEGIAGDYLTMFIELWAYLADILTFYQEIIANEAYVPTATQRNSLLQQSRLVGYRPQPGLAATTLAALTVTDGTTLSLPAGFRVGALAGPGQPPIVFETQAPLSAPSSHSAIAVASALTTNQFAALDDYAALAGRIIAATDQLPVALRVQAAAATEVYGAIPNPDFRQTFAVSPLIATAPIRVGATSATVSGDASRLKKGEYIVIVDGGGHTLRQVSSVGESASSGTTALSWAPVTTLLRSIVLAGTTNRIAVGDYLLAVTDEGATGATSALRRVAQVKVDQITASTTVTWREDPAHSYAGRTGVVHLYAFRLTAAPFGNNAPPWSSLSPALNGTLFPPTSPPSSPPPGFPPLPPPLPGPYQDTNWDDPSKPWYTLPTPAFPPDAADPPNVVFLDRLSDAVKATAENPGWAVLMTDSPTASPPTSVLDTGWAGTTMDDGFTYKVFHVIDVQPISKAAYTLSGRVTRLTFGAGESLLTADSPPSPIFPLRHTVILAAGERLTLQDKLPLPDPLGGAKLVVGGQLPQLQAHQTVVVQGHLYDAQARGPSTQTGAEACTIASSPVVDAATNLTLVPLTAALAGAYARAGTTLLANVVAVSQSQAVSDEVLGSGDGSPLQSFPLKKKPLTYVPSPGPDGRAVPTSTLVVTVNGAPWTERPTLKDSAADAHEYTTTQDDSGQTTVIFGDGVHGACPPTGSDNIRAGYRIGVGSAGNVDPGAITSLIDSAPGLLKVTNPLQARGGAGAEGSDQIRASAPSSLHVLGGAVTVADYVALARTFEGVAKASAALVTSDPTMPPYIQLTIASSKDAPPAEQADLPQDLRTFLDTRRDPNMPLRIVGYTPVYVDVAATIDVDARYARQATLAAAQAALNPGQNPDHTFGFFAFERLAIGQSIYLNDVYAALQSVPGVARATVTTLRRLSPDPDPSPVPHDIVLKPIELAVVADDPTDTKNQRGKLTITVHTGGFAAP